MLRLKRYRTNQKELERFMASYGRLRNLEPAAEGGHAWEQKTKKELEAEKVRLCRKVCAMLQETRKLDSAIDAISDGTQALILRYRYIDGLSWEEITEELCFSLRSVHYLHKKALEALAI